MQLNMKQLNLFKPMALMLCFMIGILGAVADNLATGELAWLTNGDPAMTGQATQDHFFVRGDYDDTGTMVTYDNVVSFKSGAIQTIWFYLNDDEIYQNEAVQALTPIAYNSAGDLYNEITYNSFILDVYLPEGLELTVNDDDEQFVQGDRMPNSSHLSVGRMDGTKVIDGKNYTRYTVVVYNSNAYGSHLSARTASRYRQYGALKKDYTVFGLFVKNNRQYIYEGQINDIILGYMTMNVLETSIAGWSINDGTFFYGTGGNNMSQRFMLFNRVKTYGSKGINNSSSTILATSISLNTSNLMLGVDETSQLSATIYPSNATNKTVSWKSSNTSIATVSNNGVVTAISPGTAYITATTTDGSNISSSCKVTVQNVLATSISLNISNMTLEMGESSQLVATVYPSYANKTVTWKSSNNAIATVSSNGVVTAVSPGITVITATTTDGSNLTAQCVVTIKQQATSISLNQTEATIYTGNTLQLSATVLPSTTSNPSVTWSSSNTNVATVSSTGLVTAKSTGNAVITAKTADGSNLSATCNVTVKRLATSISLNKSSATLYLDQTVQLTATVSPSNATDRSIVWSSSDISIATVSSTGLVTAIATGNAIITATTADGSNLSATCAITVNAYVTSLTLDQSAATILEGDTITLIPTILPTYATNQSLYWSSNNTGVATVNNGVVVGRTGGEATITAKTADGSNLSAVCKVTVIPNFDLSMPNFSYIRGSANNKFDLTIDLANRYDITGMQFDIHFPDGVTIAKNNIGEYDIWLDDSRKTRNHIATASLIGNSTYRILVSSATANSLKGHSGTVAHIMIEIPLYHVSGDKQVYYTNIILSEPDETRHTLPTEYSMISYYFKEGDANPDVNVDVADYVITGNYILQNNPENFWYDAANVDHNYTIDVNDLTGITNIALGRREGGILQMPAIQTLEDIVLTADPLQIQAGQTRTLNLSLDGNYAFAGFQMDMHLPRGIKLVDASLTDQNSNLSIATAELPDGSIRLLASSFSLKDLVVTNTNFLKLTLMADNSFYGDDIITLDDIKFSERNMVLHTIDGVVIPVGNNVSGLEHIYGKIRIYPEGTNIIIDTPESGTAHIITISGITYVREVLPGHNVIPMNDSGFYIVTLNGKTAKLRLK